VAVALTGLVVGLLVGLTGAGGGALLTPLLVLVFGIPGLSAVGSDLVASLVMKPVGGAVHLHRRTVRLDIAGCLSVGSVPGAAAGAAALRVAGHHASAAVTPAIGVALVLTAAAMALRPRLARRHRQLAGTPTSIPHTTPAAPTAAPGGPELRPLPTVAVGLAGGVLVGMTSVGSGSLMLAGLTLLYPGLGTPELVGTDLVQAVPLVGTAALAHLLMGDVRLALTGALLAGALPGAFVGARLSSRSSGRLVRPALAVLLLATGLRLLWV